MSVKNQIIGNFQAPDGTPLSNGYLLMQLSQDGQVNGTSQITAGSKIKILLDSNGNIVVSPTQNVWPNDSITPNTTTYTVTAYSASGQPVWGPNSVQILSSPSPYQVGIWNP